MENELNLELEPGAGLEKTAEIIGEVKAAPVDTSGMTDLQGQPFDPALHKTHPDGSPVLGSKNQLLLKKEAKKSAGQWIKDKVSKVWNGDKEADDGNFDERNIPLSDHELPPEIEQMRVENKSTMSISAGGFSAQTRICAEGTFAGYAIFLGSHVYDHRNEFYPRVCQILHEEELRTGKSLPVPEWAIMPLALAQIGAEIYHKDEKCKAEFSAKVSRIKGAVVKSSVKEAIVSKFRRKPEAGAE